MTTRPKLGIYLPTGGDRMMGGRDARWTDLLDMTRAAEDAGLDFVCVLDHLDDYWEGWSILSALAAATERITLVSYVTCTSYRNPGLVAKLADTVDEISGGRLILGLGAGDSETEHQAYGFARDRPVDRFEEAATIITRLLRDGGLDHEGRYYTLRDAELRPRGPSHGQIPILIGSLGGRRMRRISVQLADIWSAGSFLLAGNDADAMAPFLGELDDACRTHGRDPETLARMVDVLVGVEPGRFASWTDVAPLTGTPDETAERLLAYARLGVEYVNVWIEPNDVSGIDRFAPVVRAMPHNDRLEPLGEGQKA